MIEFNGSETAGEANDDFEIESGHLLTDAEAANIVYVAKVTDTNLLTRSFPRHSL